jgi:hypothetical protein
MPAAINDCVNNEKAGLSWLSGPPWNDTTVGSRPVAPAGR